MISAIYSSKDQGSKVFSFDKYLCDSVIREEGDNSRLEIKMNESLYNSCPLLSKVSYGDIFILTSMAYIVVEKKKEIKDGKVQYSYTCESILIYRLKTVKTHKINVDYSLADPAQNILEKVLEKLNFSIYGESGIKNIEYQVKLSYFTSVKGFNVDSLDTVGASLYEWFESFLTKNNAHYTITSNSMTCTNIDSANPDSGVSIVLSYVLWIDKNDSQSTHPITKEMCEEVAYSYSNQGYYPFIYYNSPPYEELYYETFYSPVAQWCVNNPTNLKRSEPVICNFNSSSWSESADLNRTIKWIKCNKSFSVHYYKENNGDIFLYVANQDMLPAKTPFEMKIPVYSNQSYGALENIRNDPWVGWMWDNTARTGPEKIKEGGLTYAKFTLTWPGDLDPQTPLFYLGAPHKQTKVFAFAGAYAPAWAEWTNLKNIRPESSVLDIKLKDSEKDAITYGDSYFYEDTKVYCSAIIDTWEKGKHTRDVEFKLVL